MKMITSQTQPSVNRAEESSLTKVQLAKRDSTVVKMHVHVFHQVIIDSR